MGMTWLVRERVWEGHTTFIQSIKVSYKVLTEKFFISKQNSFHFLLLDLTWPLLDNKFQVDEHAVDINFISDYFVYESIEVRQEDGCRMLCYFQSECVFYFFKHTQYTQRYGKSYRTYTKNCFFGKFESKYVKSSYNSYVYNHYDDYDELSQRDGYRHYSTPPRPNTFNFEFSTFIQLTTKLTEENKKVNVTGSMINGLHLGPQKTNWYGKCQGAGIHVITNTTWDLDFKLVYKDNKPCFFKILRLVKGYMKLRIPNFAVRFSPKILHQLHYELDVF